MFDVLEKFDTFITCEFQKSLSLFILYLTLHTKINPIEPTNNPTRNLHTQKQQQQPQCMLITWIFMRNSMVGFI